MVCISITIQKKIEYEISQRKKTVFCQSQLYFVCSWLWSMSLSVCLMLGLINERRPGPPRGPVEDDILLFCYESFSPRNRRNSPKWRRARLNYSTFTINFHPPFPHLDTSLDHRVCRLIMGMLTIPCAIHTWALWQHERLWEHGFLWVCNLAKLTVELLIQLFYLGAILVWKKKIWLKLERTHLALI